MKGRGGRGGGGARDNLTPSEDKFLSWFIGILGGIVIVCVVGGIIYALIQGGNP